jgi:mannose-6-phosphate isomerase-like protein (cupin superfamily)
MRGAFLLSLLLSVGSLVVQAQAQPTPPPVSRPPAAPSRGGLALTVTDASGRTLPGVHVEVLGVSDRSGDSDESGQVEFTGMQAGTYRLRFSGDPVITYEREMTIRAGRVANMDVTLNEAPPAPAPDPAPPAPPPPPPAAAPVGPIGRPQMVSIVDLVESELIENKEPRRDTLISCSGNTRTTMVQLNEDQEERKYDSAEISYYVVAGEGAIKVGGRETALAASSFVALPRGAAHTVIHKSRRPLIMLVTLSGAPCEQPR